MATAPTPLDERPGTSHSPLHVVLGAFVALGAIGIAAAVLLALAGDESSTSTVVVGSGVPATATRSLPPFGDVELAGSNNVTIRLGQEQSVSVHGDDNLVGLVTTDVESGTLVIDNRPVSLRTRSPMAVEVAMPSVSNLTLSGSGTINVTGMDELDVTVLLSGSGVVRAQGSTYGLTATVTGSGRAELGRLVAGDVVAVVAGSGNIRVTATDSLVAAVPGTGSIVYAGNPTSVTTAVTGIGAITRG